MPERSLSEADLMAKVKHCTRVVATPISEERLDRPMWTVGHPAEVTSRTKVVNLLV
jgi:hypothetical protein